MNTQTPGRPPRAALRRQPGRPQHAAHPAGDHGPQAGEPRPTAVGGRVIDNQFWMVSEHGDHSDYVQNIKADPGCGCVGRPVAHRHRASAARRRPVARLAQLPAGTARWCVMGTDLLTVRVDLD